jgi:aminopeptidase-like protein
MKKLEVVYSKEAVSDLQKLSDVIMYKYKAPLTAVSYLNELQKEIKRLSVLADSLPYYTRPQLQKYGQNTKRINYKQMAIIFAVFGPIVYIHRIIPANTIASR